MNGCGRTARVEQGSGSCPLLARKIRWPRKRPSFFRRRACPYINVVSGLIFVIENMGLQTCPAWLEPRKFTQVLQKARRGILLASIITRASHSLGLFRPSTCRPIGRHALYHPDIAAPGDSVCPCERRGPRQPEQPSRPAHRPTVPAFNLSSRQEHLPAIVVSPVSSSRGVLVGVNTRVRHSRTTIDTNPA